MITASDLRKGLRIEFEGIPYIITEFNFVKPGKGQGIYTCKLKNLLNGATTVRNFRDNARFEEPDVEDKHLRFSYEEGDNLVFLDDAFEQISIPGSVLGDKKKLLVEDAAVAITFYNGQAIDVEMPTFVEKKVVHSEPGVKGDTATNVTKPATLEGGYILQVPLFVNQGDVVRVDTRTGEYLDRASRK